MAKKTDTKTTKAAKAKKPGKAKAAPEAAATKTPPAKPSRRYYEEELPMTRVRPSGSNPRKNFPPEYIEELAASIEAEGLLQPIAVRVVEADEEGRDCEIVLGECRWRACARLGEAFIRATVYEGVDDQLALRMALVENLQRLQMNPIEEAEGFRALQATGLTQVEIAAEVKRSRAVVANMMRLLDLPPDVVELLRSGALTTAHGMALARFKQWPGVCGRMAELAVEEATPAGQLEKGIPFGRKLQRDGWIEELPGYGEEADSAERRWRKDPACVAVKGPYGTEYFVMDGPAYRAWLEEWQAKQTEKLRKKIAAAGGSAVGDVLDLRKLGYSNYEEVSRIPAEVKKELPPEAFAVGKSYGDRVVEVCVDMPALRKVKMAQGRVKKKELKERIAEVETVAADKLADRARMEGVLCKFRKEIAYLVSHLSNNVRGDKLADLARSLDISLPEGAVSESSYGLRSWEALARMEVQPLLRFVTTILLQQEVAEALRANSEVPRALLWFADRELAAPAPEGLVCHLCDATEEQVGLDPDEWDDDGAGEICPTCAERLRAEESEEEAANSEKEGVGS